jgi:hypothetical protein
VIEALRTPLESGVITLTRSEMQTRSCAVSASWRQSVPLRTGATRRTLPVLADAFAATRRISPDQDRIDISNLPAAVRLS